MRHVWYCTNPEIDHVQAPRCGDDRIEIDLDDLGYRVGELAEAHQQCFQRRMIDHSACHGSR